MIRQVLLRSLAVGVLTVVLTATSANAEIWRHRDARGDAGSTVYGEDGTATTTVDPTIEIADITRLVVRHKAQAVLVDLHLRDLRRVGYADAVMRLQTPRVTYDAVATYGRDDPGSVELRQGSHFVNCRWSSANFRPHRDKIRVRLPRACLDDPRWVRVRAGFTSFDVDEQDHTTEWWYSDDALATATW